MKLLSCIPVQKYMYLYMHRLYNTCTQINILKVKRGLRLAGIGSDWLQLPGHKMSTCWWIWNSFRYWPRVQLGFN